MPKGIYAWDDLNDGRNPAPMGRREETGLTIVMNFGNGCHSGWLNFPPKAAHLSNIVLASESFPLRAENV